MHFFMHCTGNYGKKRTYIPIPKLKKVRKFGPSHEMSLNLAGTQYGVSHFGTRNNAKK